MRNLEGKGCIWEVFTWIWWQFLVRRRKFSKLLSPGQIRENKKWGWTMFYNINCRQRVNVISTQFPTSFRSVCFTSRSTNMTPGLGSLLFLVKILARMMEAVLGISCVILQAFVIRLLVTSYKFSNLPSPGTAKTQKIHLGVNKNQTFLWDFKIQKKLHPVIWFLANLLRSWLILHNLANLNKK